MAAKFYPNTKGTNEPLLGLVTVCLRWDRKMLVWCHGSSLRLGTRVEFVCEGASRVETRGDKLWRRIIMT